VENNFIVINTKKVFEEGHSHMSRFDVVKMIIDLAIRKELPKNSKFVKSLIRISTDKEFTSINSFY